MYRWNPLCRHLSVLFFCGGFCPKEARNKESVSSVYGDLISCSMRDEPVPWCVRCISYDPEIFPCVLVFRHFIV